MFNEGGFFGSGGFLEKAGTAVLSLPNQVINFGEDLGDRIFGGIQAATEGFESEAMEQGQQFTVDRAGAKAAGFLSNNLPLLILAAVIAFLAFKGK